jgi:hypothetical protein
MDGFNCIQDQPNPMYKMPWAQVFIRVVCTPAIGALKQGLELFLSDRTTASTDMTKLAGDVDTQSRIAAVRNIIDECETITRAIYEAIDRSTIGVVGHIETQCEEIRFSLDPDGLTRRGLMSFRVVALA